MWSCSLCLTNYCGRAGLGEQCSDQPSSIECLPPALGVELIPSEPVGVRGGKKYYPGILLEEEEMHDEQSVIQRCTAEIPVTCVGLFKLMILVTERRKGFRLIFCLLPFTWVIDTLHIQKYYHHDFPFFNFIMKHFYLVFLFFQCFRIILLANYLYGFKFSLQKLQIGRLLQKHLH